MFHILYKTINVINGKEYIGVHSTKNLEDGYLGSGLAIKRAINKYGKQNFIRTILEFCNSESELLEKEAVIVNEEWVENPNTYNMKTGGQSKGNLSKKSRLKISTTLKRKYASGEIIPVKQENIVITQTQKDKISKTLKERYQNESHHLRGRDPWNKNLKGSQIAWNKGIQTGSMADKQKLEISNTLKERYKTKTHPRKGKSSWCAGTKGIVKAWNKGIELPKSPCPHCNLLVDAFNGRRWHFDNCKKNSNDCR